MKEPTTCTRQKALLGGVGRGGPDNELNGKASVPFSGFRCQKDRKGKGFHQLKYMKRKGNL